MAGNRVLEPPRNLDPELRLRAQVADLAARIALLERNSDSVVQKVASGVSTVTLDVPSTAAFATIDFELITPCNAEMLLRPNTNTGTLVTDALYTNSTVAANSIAGPTVAQASMAGGRLIPATHGSVGLTGSVGTLQVQLRGSSPGRRTWNAFVRTTNTSGPSNFYTYTWIVGGAIDSNIGTTVAINSLQIVCSTGTYTSGTVRTTFT